MQNKQSNSDLKLTLVRKFSSIRKEWSRLYSLTPQVSPFLHPVAFDISVKYFFPYYLRYSTYPLFAVVSRGGEIIAIVPLLKSGKSAQLLGNVNGFNECGFVFKDERDIPDILNLLKEHFTSVHFSRISDWSIISTHKGTKFTEKPNVAIHFGDDFDELFKSLSSSVRQNIRTAYNRLAKDEKTFSLDVYRGGDKDIPISSIIDLYSKRHNQRYGLKISWLKNWFLKHLSFATRFYKHSPNALTFLLSINGQPAAFMSGLFEHDRLIVPRLSIDNEFKRYSPGMILVCETIKYLISNTKIRVLDLSQGEEGYKYQLGGEKYLSYSFDV